MKILPPSTPAPAAAVCCTAPISIASTCPMQPMPAPCNAKPAPAVLFGRKSAMRNLPLPVEVAAGEKLRIADDVPASKPMIL